tara:strand:+ start:245 stop:472 length:228 start_codon:yes stop_codon:yes gene_type:complete
MNKLLNIARAHCANWDAGKCVGCVFTRTEKGLSFRLSEKLSGQKCSVEKGCEYFENIVIPGMQDKITVTKLLESK